MGNVFFNVLSLECAEPKYRKICYNSTRQLPRRGKLFFNFFSSSIDNVKENEENIICHHWTLDKSFPPNFVFRKPNRVFWINRFMRKKIVFHNLLYSKSPYGHWWTLSFSLDQLVTNNQILNTKFWCLYCCCDRKEKSSGCLVSFHLRQKHKIKHHTGKSFSEALILASVSPQYEERLLL